MEPRVSKQTRDGASDNRISRRTLLRGGATAGLLTFTPGLLTACGSGDGGSGSLKRLVIAAEADPKSLNEIIDPGQGIRELVNTQDGLLNRSGDYRTVVPGLATDLPEMPDDLTYKFTLREGVSFHNGDPLTAHDVVYSLLRLKNNPKASFGALYRDTVESVEALDDRRIVIKTTRPYSIFTSLLSGNHTKIVNKKLVERPGYGNRLWSGTGPFEVSEWAKGDHVTLKKARKANSPQGEARLDEVVFRTVPDPSARLQALRSGQVDVALHPDYKDISEFEDSSDYKVVKVRGSSQTLMTFKTSMKPFDKREVRLAMSLAINRKRLVEDFFYGYASVSGDLFPTWHWAHDKSIPVPYDPDKAKSLLSSVGFDSKNPLTFTAMILQDKLFLDQATAIQGQLKEIGVRMKIRPVEYTTLSAITASGPNKWLGPVAMFRITPLRGTSYEFSYYQYGKEGGLNRSDFNKKGGLQRPDIEQALLDVTSESDWNEQRDKKQKPAWSKLCQKIADDPPQLILNYWDRVSLVSKDVKDWTGAVYDLIQLQPVSVR